MDTFSGNCKSRTGSKTHWGDPYHPMPDNGNMDQLIKFSS